MTSHLEYQEQLDTRALELAGRALTKIEEHEKLSNAQYITMMGVMRDTKDSIDKLFDRFWIAAVAAIGILLAVLAFFVTDFVRTTNHPVQTQVEKNK